MRVGLLTSYWPHDMAIAWTTLPLMRRYVRSRGYTLAVGQGMSAEGMFDRFGDQFETAMLFVPITFLITNSAIRIEHSGYRQTEAPPKLGVDCANCSLAFIRWLAVNHANANKVAAAFNDGIIDREDMMS